ncbi:hypothetical protein I203_105742 [Kwoniella mangroviensis CBS 8507]|uniref:uncharacterized protein n=1 Tax=Kwoniella mangroviensis CBS 8507 TaxID=1296122 RepID=UPI00080D34D4|nr:uncharacterized protein I203_01554 [Kwoniella mangroviensis CBS 8507]OCF69690.1 hypothetical protein I203_01554 [Kwoniella mangroviensis CBS 8507]
MAPIILSRPNNPHRNSSNTSASSSFRSLFTQPNSKLSQTVGEAKVEDNRILPVKDFPPQAERRRSSAPTLAVEPDSENGTSSPSSQTKDELPEQTNTPRSEILHKRSHSLRRKPVPSLLLNAESTATPLPLPLPMDHPFATKHNKHDSSSSSLKSFSTGNSATSSINRNPMLTPERSMGRTPPPPPRRTVNSPKEDEESMVIRKKKNARPDTAGTFGGRQSLEEDRPATATENHQGQLSRIDKEDALHARMISLSLDRPLPPTPTGPEDKQLQVPPSATLSPKSNPPRITRPSVDTNTSKSMDLINILRHSPSIPLHTSVPMSKNGSSGSGSGTGSGSKFRSKILNRWDSSEKVKKSSATSSSSKKDTNNVEEEFSVDRIPSKKDLWEAGTCFLRDENGDLKCFGDFFPKYREDTSSTLIDDHQNDKSQSKGKGKEKEFAASAGMEKSATYSGASSQNQVENKVYKTVVFFIRHFWCGQCQDYTFASLSLLDPVALERAGIRVVVISNGSWKIIKAYKKLFNCPFPIYVDGPRRLYQLMGMTKMTNDFGPLFKGRAAYHQRTVPGQLVHGLGNAFFRMPLANPGTLTQLGGEFILTPGWNCEFAHRMTTTSDHMEAPDVLRLAGCAHPTKSDAVELELADSQKAELEKLEKEMKEWQEQRVAELERIRQKKAARRGITYEPTRRDSNFTFLEGEKDISEISFENEVNQALSSPKELKEILSRVEEPSEIGARLEDVLQVHESREREKLAARQLMLARGKGDLEVRVDSAKAY